MEETTLRSIEAVVRGLIKSGLLTRAAVSDIVIELHKAAVARVDDGDRGGGEQIMILANAIEIDGELG